jgi:hypothetical protein
MDISNFIKNGNHIMEVSFSSDELIFEFDSEASLTESLKKKVKEHNDKVGDVPSKRTSLSVLRKVYKRGVGAYRTNPSSVRPSVKSAQQWAMARVNSFLRALTSGKFKSGKHDTDLLPKGHPMAGPAGKDGRPLKESKSSYDDDLDKDGEEVEAVAWAKEKEKGVKLNKPFRTPSGPKKFSVYVKNEKGNIVKVNFGDPNMEIKRDDPERRKSFRARHQCDTNPGPKWKARYWSCRMWESGKSVKNLTS